MLTAWLPLASALNELNRSLGQADLYPFVIAPPVAEKLSFVHDLVVASSGVASAGHDRIEVPQKARQESTRSA
jgi:hypothetical protein